MSPVRSLLVEVPAIIIYYVYYCIILIRVYIIYTLYLFTTVLIML